MPKRCLRTRGREKVAPRRRPELGSRSALSRPRPGAGRSEANLRPEDRPRPGEGRSEANFSGPIGGHISAETSYLFTTPNPMNSRVTSMAPNPTAFRYPEKGKNDVEQRQAGRSKRAEAVGARKVAGRRGPRAASCDAAGTATRREPRRQSR